MNKYEKLNYILPSVIFLLVIAQFDNSNVDSIGINFFVVAVVTLLIYFFNYFGKSTFLFLCILIISSFFVLFQPVGHTFAIATVIILFLNVLKGKSGKEIAQVDSSIAIIIFIFILFNVLGWLFKSQLEPRYFITAVITFFSFILVFNLARKIVWNDARLKIFFSIICFIMLYTFLTAINNPLNIIPLKTPLLKSYEMEVHEEGTMFISMIGRPSTAIGVMYALFLLPFFVTGNYKFINIKGGLMTTGFIASLLVCILGFSKSHSVVLLLGLLLGIYLMILFFSLRFAYAVNLFSGIIIIAIFVYFSSTFISYNYIFKRFDEQPELFKSMMDNPFKAKGTSREVSFKMGLESLARENWFIGYGYANGGRNRIAWMGAKLINYKKKDFHNQYYSLPQVFGWAGSVAYLLFFIITIQRMRKVVIFKLLPIQYRLTALSFMLFFIIHLLAEFTMTGLSSPNYMFMLFIMLGLANSLYYHYQRNRYTFT
jgi:hypothetical protein